MSNIVLPHADLTLRSLKSGGHDIEWRNDWKVEKFREAGGRRFDRDRALGLVLPYEVIEGHGNLLTTVGATDLWNGLSTAGLANPWNTTNTYLGSGDSTTAASAGQTDLQAASGATMNAGDFTGATNATPIVLTTSSWSTTPVVGNVIVVAGILGNTAANGTFEVQAVNATTVTLKNSAGNGAFATSAGSTAKPINRYLQQANATGSAVVTSASIVYVAAFPTANGNYAWQEWATMLATATNKQGAAPAKMLNRVVASLGTKVSGTWTLTSTLSLA